jgi:hypothetical protein
MRKMTKPVLLVASALALSGVSACGLTGDLKRPAPIYGEPSPNLEPAKLPDAGNDDLPELPERSDAIDPDTPPNSDDELLGGPGGF